MQFTYSNLLLDMSQNGKKEKKKDVVLAKNSFNKLKK